MKLDHTSTAIVVGGASGLGEATVRALRQAGVPVSLLDRDATRGRALATETGADFFEVDVTDEASVLAAFDRARSKQGQERILVHTPAIGGGGAIVRRDVNGTIERHDFAQFERVVRVNLGGTFLCASVAAAGMMTLEPMEDGERAVVILTSSIVSKDIKTGMPAYTVSKAGVNALTHSMALDLGSEGIRVNCIVPGSFATPMTADLPDSFKSEMVRWTAHPKRFGAPSEYASLALEMVRNTYLNGAEIRLDGGAHG